MNTEGFALFDTPVGKCGIAWGERGVTSVQLPETNEAATRARLAGRFPEARELPPPRDVKRAVGAIVALLRGEQRDLTDITLDMTGVPPFHRRVYELARSIGPGATLSYGDVAQRLGKPGSARAVGQALGRNPFAIVVPCHRVLASGGKMGGFSAKGGVMTKARLLSIETPNTDGPLFEGDGNYGFDPKVAVRALRKADPVLGELIDAVGPFRMQLQQTPDLFLALAEAIVHQQLTAKAAATIFARVRALVPRGERFSAERLLRIRDERLRGAGLSGAKTAALKDLATKAKAREIPTLPEVHRMDDAEIIERLTRVRGIGRWTVEMLLMFRLGRADVLPVDDYGVRKGYAVAFRKRALPTPKELEALGEPWRPYRSVASWYLWRALDEKKSGD